MKKIKILILGIISAMTFSSCGYNTMVEKQEAVEAQWAQVENVYQRRADLIPNLVATVKGYATHENETLEGVIEARANATNVTIDPTKLTEANMAQFQKAQEGLSGALSRLMAVREAYPELKANENFRDLSAQLEGAENRISTERNRYNDVARGYNTFIRQFPRNIIAMIFGFENKPYFNATEGAERAPEVKF